MAKTVALVLAAAAISAPLGSAGAADRKTAPGFSLPVGVPGPASGALDRLHTVARLPAGSEGAAIGPAKGEPASALAPRPAGVVTVSQ